MRRFWNTAAEVLIWLWLLAVAVGCTVIAFNRAPVTTTVDDSHAAGGAGGGTNQDGRPNRTFDVNISPR